MKKLNSTIRVNELADTAMRMVDFYKKETALAGDSYLKPLYRSIDEVTLEIIFSIKKESNISKLENADVLRDESIKNLKNILIGYSSMRTKETREAAEYLLNIFNRYGVKITRESYASQSALIKSMLNDFATSEAQKYIEKLNEVKETIIEIGERQEIFHNRRMDYEKSVSDNKKIASASSLKKTLLELINLKLVPFLIAMKEIDLYKNLASVIEQVIKDANELTARRRTKAKPSVKEKKEDNL